MTAQYRLFYSPGACSMASHIVLEELGASYEAVCVTIAQGENRKPEYLSVNPRGRVPALWIKDDKGERVVTESLAILTLLSQRHPQAKLMPGDPEPFVRTLEWMSWLASTMHQTGVRAVLRPERFTKDANGAAGIKAQGLEVVVEGLRDIEARLPEQGWAMGEHFGALDAYLLVFYRWGNRVGIPMREQFPRFTRLMDAVRARPAVARVIAREDIQID
mgnify:CR=1 FL=1